MGMKLLKLFLGWRVGNSFWAQERVCDPMMIMIKNNSHAISFASIIVHA